MVDFSSILSKPADVIEKPKPKPVGTYIAVVEGMPSQETPTWKGVERAVIEFKLKPMAAQQVDDQDALAEAGDISNWPALRQNFAIDDPNGEYQLVKFLSETLGIDKAGKSLSEMLTESAGRQLLLTLGHRPYVAKDGTPEIGVEIKSTAKL